MGLSGKLNEHPRIVGAAAVAVTLTVVTLVALPHLRGEPVLPPQLAYYLDPASGELFAASAAAAPPIAAPAAGGGDEHAAAGAPRAYVFACGSCGDAGQRFVGYVLQLTPRAKAALAQRSGLPFLVPPPLADGTLLPAGPPLGGRPGEDSPLEVASPEQPLRWFPADSRQAAALVAQVRTACEGSVPRPCEP